MRRRIVRALIQWSASVHIVLKWKIVHFQFLHQCVVPKFFPYVGYVALGHAITSHARKVIVGAEPSLLQFMLEAALDHGMMSKFTHINRTQPIDLCRNRILFDQRFFCESELQRIIGRQ